MAAADAINKTIRSKRHTPTSSCAAMKTTSNSSSLLREACAVVKPQWKVRVQFTRVRANGELELVRVLLRGSDLIAAFVEAAANTATVAGDVQIEDVDAAAIADFQPSDLQRKILAALADGPKTTGQLAAILDVTSARLFDRGKVLHELVDRGLVAKQSRGYALTEPGREFVADAES